MTGALEGTSFCRCRQPAQRVRFQHSSTFFYKSLTQLLTSTLSTVYLIQVFNCRQILWLQHFGLLHDDLTQCLSAKCIKHLTIHFGKQHLACSHCCAGSQAIESSCCHRAIFLVTSEEFWNLSLCKGSSWHQWIQSHRKEKDSEPNGSLTGIRCSHQMQWGCHNLNRCFVTSRITSSNEATLGKPRI